MSMIFQRAAASRPISANRTAARQAVMLAPMNLPNFMIYAVMNTNMAVCLQVDGTVLYKLLYLHYIHAI